MPNPLFDQGPYDSATFDDLVPATWPQVTRPAGALYQPGMWWTSTGTGIVSGQPATPGDFIFVTFRERTYGDFNYGSDVYGSGTSNSADWGITEVAFHVWVMSDEPWYQPPFPYSGCPFDESRHPGWRIVIDSLYNSGGGRTYGLDTYGAQTYGNDNASDPAMWSDITRPGYLVSIAVGTSDGAQTIDVTEIAIELHDDDGVWLDFATPERYFQPFVGDPIRVGFLAPDLSYHPMAVGTIEQIRDDHDTLPRFVSVQAFGHLSDLVNTVGAWQRPAELTSQRIAALVAAGGWRFSALDLAYPGPDIALLADTAPTDIVVRNELDRTAASVGWMFDTDPWGILRVREWPLAGAAPEIVATDCLPDGPPGAVLASLIAFVADTSQILNNVVMTNVAVPPVTVTADDQASIAKYGGMTEALSYPHSDLAFVNATDAAPIARRILNRFANIITHAEDVTGDTLVDGNWLHVLVDLDTGQAIHVDRTGIRPFELDGVVVGFDHQITPGRIVTAIHTATTTPTY